MPATDTQARPPPPGTPLTVYYDRSCPLCRTELESLARQAPELELTDCSPAGFCDPIAADARVDRKAMMAALHVRDADGRWHRGVDAFSLLYQRAGYPRVARWLSSDRLRPVHDFLYRRVAHNRQRLSRLGLHHLLARILGKRESRVARQKKARR